MIWVGTCGFARSRVESFRALHAVEVQETFYRPVAPERARRWRSAAPDTFLFTVKASQFITHPASSPTYRRSGRTIPTRERSAYGGFQDTPQVRAGWEETRGVVEALRAKVVVFQCPSSFGATPEHVAALYRFFESIRTDAAKAWEPRGAWPSHIVEKACEDLGLIHAVDPFASEPATYGLAYFRLHWKPPGSHLYRYTYTEPDLHRLRAMAEEYDDAYAMFNNVTSYDDALRFLASFDSSREPNAERNSGKEKDAERFL